MSPAPAAAPKCCPHCSADFMPIGPAGLCWLCRKPLSQAPLSYVPPLPAPLVPSPYDAPAAPAPPASESREAPLPRSPRDVVHKYETAVTMGAIVAGLTAVCLSSTDVGYGVGLVFILAGFLPAILSKPNRTFKTMSVMAWAGFTIIVVLVSGTIALNIVCISKMSLGPR